MTKEYGILWEMLIICPIVGIFFSHLSLETLIDGTSLFRRARIEEATALLQI